MRRPFLYGLAAFCVFQLLALPGPAAQRPVRRISGGGAGARDLTFEERVRAQEAIERVRYSHQIDATKPFEEAVPRAALEDKVRKYLKQSAAIETIWKTQLSPGMLHSEAEREARGTRMPERLRELYAALGNDPFLAEECLARPLLAERLARSFFAHDERIHSEARRAADALRGELAAGRLDPFAEHPDRTIVDLARGEPGRDDPVPPGGHDSARVQLAPAEYDSLEGQLPDGVGTIGPLVEEEGAFLLQVVLDRGRGTLRLATFSVKKTSWDVWWTDTAARLDETSIRSVSGSEALPVPRATGDTSPATPCGQDDTWDNGSLDDLPSPRRFHTTVWTGSLAIVWGGFSHDRINTGSRYDPATDSWSSTTTLDAPKARSNHVAVWAGSEMIVWGGSGTISTDPGGRYDPLTDRWTPISTVGAPPRNDNPAGVWTGSLMIVWGGVPGDNTGGRYDPATDLWTPTSTVGAPTGRFGHSVIWTGQSMIVWGGQGSLGTWPDTGGRYDPAMDLWTPTSTIGAPTRRRFHTAVWTGSEMIVWGGDVFGSDDSTGGRYEPVFDRWMPTSTTNAPAARRNHTAVWTGSRMVVWGGRPENDGSPYFNSGGQYDPGTDSWTPTATLGAPSARGGQTAVWTGSLMVVWGGNSATANLDSGGRYEPGTDHWTPTSRPGGDYVRASHTAVWTGNEMVVWGGYVPFVAFSLQQVGARYDPVTDSFAPTSTVGAPSPRYSHTAVWTGQRMIVWGGQGSGSTYTDTGGRYDPVTDTWAPTSTAGAPSPRIGQSAVWTGDRMILWGGAGTDDAYTGTGGRYDPEADQWAPTSMADAPTPRSGHTAVWTGNRMVVWGGVAGQSLSPVFFNTGGRYDPVTDTWSPTTLTNVPSTRMGHTAVWTGSHMVVWGGEVYHYVSLEVGFIYTYYQSGGIYDAVNDSWASTSTFVAPAYRAFHSAVWTGTRMVVWGGSGGTGSLDSGGRYDPNRDEWAATSTIEAPTPRRNHTAVWTGGLMVIWGGDAGGGRYCASTNQSPTADAGPDQTVECAGVLGATTVLDGSDSTDPDSTPGTNDDIASFDWYEGDGPTQQTLGSGESLPITLSLGAHAVTLKVTDKAGTSSTATMIVNVVDTTPPMLTVHTDPATLWPPNHELVPVHVWWEAIDLCDGAATVLLAAAASSEPDDARGSDDGATTGDIQGADIGTPDTEILMRTERDGKGPGRVYTLTYNAQDSSGNTSPGLATVTVAHDQNGGPEPLLMRLEPDGTPGMVRVYWPATPGWTVYDMISGDLSLTRVENGQLSLGPVRVLVRGTTETSYSEGDAGVIPPMGGAFFYLIQPHAGGGGLGYGTESAPWPRVPVSCDGGCP